ncbi:hypothetical protein ZWY2020_045207 [Hordeum vulgare]|nr:hypothetical protein ZWY2020_045207 [Hordeum vulgare]
MDMLHQFHVRLEEESRLRQEAQDNALLQQEQAMKMQQTLIQQQEFMAKQQAALQKTFARFSNNMQCSTLPDLPPVPPLPTFSLVAWFAGYVIEHSAYRHGERNLASTIMAMAQDFVGSNNNINLLDPRGQFGSRNLGSLKETSSNADGVTYTISGVIEEVGDRKLKITELPVRRWTVDYRDFLESMCPIPQKYNGKVNNKEPLPFVEEIMSRCNHASVEFEVILTNSHMEVAKQEGLEKKFQLTTTIGTTNMYLLDSCGEVQKYDTPVDILKEFFELRLKYYYKRKEVMLENIREELLKVKNKVRFIRSVISGDIVVVNRTIAELILELKKKHYYNPSPKKNITGEQVALGAMEENDVSHVEAASGVDASDYEYLLAMAICTMTREKAQELIAQEDKLHDELKSLGETDPKLLWLGDLNALEKELDVIKQFFSLINVVLDVHYVFHFILSQCFWYRWLTQNSKPNRSGADVGGNAGVAKAAPKRQPNTKTVAKSQ